MTKGKNKKIQKGGMKSKQNANHPFLKKQWFKVYSCKAMG